MNSCGSRVRTEATLSMANLTGVHLSMANPTRPTYGCLELCAPLSARAMQALRRLP
jgi:hypothetical protein